MTKDNFIFSNGRSHRIARHAAFWAVWCMAYLLLFHYPIHSFRGWNLSDTSTGFQNDGITTIGFILKTLIFNTLLCVVVPQAIFTYVILYYVVPKYFFRKRNPFIIACVLLAVLLIHLLVALHFKYMVDVGNYLFVQKAFTPYSVKMSRAPFYVTQEQLTSLPIVTGFALLITLVKRWWLKQKETAKLANEKTKAELQLLKAQVHPHFLFNTLNNIYFFTLSGSPKAAEMISKLSGLLHYILNECNEWLVPLEKEINMLSDYMALEKIRYGDQMNMTIQIEEGSSRQLAGEARREMIAPLLLIPFVENSFKHGASKMLTHPWVKLCINIENSILHFFISNSRPHEEKPHLQKGNIGLKNVKKRLQLLYAGTHELHIVSEPECFTVSLKIQLQETGKSIATNHELNTEAAYAMA